MELCHLFSRWYISLGGIVPSKGIPKVRFFAPKDASSTGAGLLCGTSYPKKIRKKKIPRSICAQTKTT